MSTIAKPRFQKNSDDAIFKEFRADANKIIVELEPRRRSTIMLKAILLPALYFGTYAAALYFNSVAILYACYFVLGILLVSIFLNLIHDAVHGTIFKSSALNQIYVYLFDLMGANSYTWKLRHVRFHHNYPNINGWDTDIEQSKLVRIFPSSDWFGFHKYQHIYMLFVYPLYLINWLLVRDFKDFFDKKRTIRKLVDIPRAEFVKLFLFKAIFIFYLIVAPRLVMDISWGQAIIAFLIMLFTGSILSLAVLLSLHVNTEVEFPLPDQDNQIGHSWMRHMLVTTNDVTQDNWFTRFFMGCFNYHVAHHLLPNVNHIYYPEITRLLKDYATRYDLPYRSFPLFASLADHYQLLKQNRFQENIFEETM